MDSRTIGPRLAEGDEGAKRCRRCGKVKPLECFEPVGLSYRNFCRTCRNRASAAYHRSERGKQARRARMDRPGAREKKADQQRKYASGTKGQAARRLYFAGARWRLIDSRRHARQRASRGAERIVAAMAAGAAPAAVLGLVNRLAGVVSTWAACEAELTRRDEREGRAAS